MVHNAPPKQLKTSREREPYVFRHADEYARVRRLHSSMYRGVKNMRTRLATCSMFC